MEGRAQSHTPSIVDHSTHILISLSHPYGRVATGPRCQPCAVATGYHPGGLRGGDGVRWLFLWHVDGEHDALGDGVVVESVLALVGAPTALLVAAKRASHVKVVVWNAKGGGGGQRCGGEGGSEEQSDGRGPNEQATGWAHSRSGRMRYIACAAYSC